MPSNRKFGLFFGFLFALATNVADDSAKRNLCLANGVDDTMRGSYLGLLYTDEQVCTQINSVEAIFSEHTDSETSELAGQALADGKAIGTRRRVFIVI